MLHATRCLPAILAVPIQHRTSILLPDLRLIELRLDTEIPVKSHVLCKIFARLRT